MNSTALEETPVVLVVEDDDALRELVCDWLQELGYRTEQASSGADALALISDGGIDVLFTDVILPGAIDGFELSIAATQRNPSLRVLFASGCAWGPNQEDEPGTTFLHKPFIKAELAQSMRVVSGA